MAGLRPATLLKKDSNTGLSCEFCGILKNAFLYRTPPVAASANSAELEKHVIILIIVLSLHFLIVFNVSIFVFIDFLQRVFSGFKFF